MATLLRLCTCFCLLQIVTCACKYGAKPCDWEPWQPWSSCSRTCGVGYRTRKRNMCCGPVLTDCVDDCYGDKDDMQSEVCNDSCPNGATLVGDLCKCPPMTYGICCNKDESDLKATGGCARHCIWTHWYSWGDCNTSCGCGTKKRTRQRCCSRKISKNGTLCKDDCNLEGNTQGTVSCTQACSSTSGPNGCSLCSWNEWGPWGACSTFCQGQRLRSRSPCCCSGQAVEDCLADCSLAMTGATQRKPCNQHCLHGRRSYNNKCVCKTGFTGKCCSKEVMVSACKKCSWQTWQHWEATGEDGKMRRRRELCCRVGLTAEDCVSGCRAEEHSQVQILLNSDEHLEIQTAMNNTINNTLESTHSDLYMYLYAGVSSLASVIVTSLAWACWYHLNKKGGDGNLSPGSSNKPGNVYQMSVRGQELEDWYEDMDSVSNQADTGNYVNVE